MIARLRRKIRGNPGLALVLPVLLLSAFLCFAFLGHMPLSDRDEGEYGAAVAAMYRYNDFVVPTLNGRAYLEKPILVFWAIAGGWELFGHDEFGTRIPMAASAFLLICITYAMAYAIKKDWLYAALSASALAFTPLFVLLARACLTDMLLTLWTTGALFCFFVGSEAEDGPHRKWFQIGWALMGLAFLTKGPVGPAVVLPTAMLYALWQRRFWATLRRAEIIFGVLVFIVINLPWYGLVLYWLGETFWQAFFVSQNLRRFSEVLLGHGGGFLFYLPVVIFGCFPFVGPGAVALARALFRTPLQVRRAEPMRRFLVFCAIGFVVTLAVFSAAATKQPNYILPALPFLALLAGHSLWRLAAGHGPAPLAKKVVFWVTIISGGLLTLIIAAVPLALPLFWDKILASVSWDASEYAFNQLPPQMWTWPVICALCGALMVACFHYLWSKGRMTALVLVFCLSAALFSGTAIMGILNQASDLFQVPAKEMALEVKQKAGEEAKVVTYALWKPSLLYYLDWELQRLRYDDTENLASLLKGEKPVLVLSRTRLADRLKDIAGFKSLAAYQGYMVGGNQAAVKLWSQSSNEKTGG